MRLRLAIVVTAAVVLGALALAPAGGEPSEAQEPVVEERSPRSLPAAVGRTAEPSQPETEPEPWQRAFASRTAQVRSDCGLDVQTTCDRRGCVAVTTAPDLDRFSGWVQLLAENPRFVLSTAARDLGVPASVIPCGSAIAGLSGRPATASVALPDGSEVWCMPTDGSGEARWDDAQRNLCDDAAAALVGPEAAGFGADDLRILRFDRKGAGDP